MHFGKLNASTFQYNNEMIIRTFQKNDLEAVQKIFALYWNDPVFLKELSQKLEAYINQSKEYLNEQLRFFVAEEKNEVIGITGFRNAPDYLKAYAKTNNPVGLYIIAVKYKHKGIGKELKSKIMEEAKNLGLTEVIVYSPNSHKESWIFHDKFGFERGPAIIDPDGEPGQIWRKNL
jgi:L-amino acid N-acyltransferase YncA